MKENIEVAYETEFDEILDRLGLKGDLEAGGLRCGFCHQRLNIANVVGVYSDGKNILLCCDRTDCTSRLAERSK